MPLDPVTQKVVEKCIAEVLREYTDDTKCFTADTLHYLRSKISNLVKDRLGTNQIEGVDVGIDLTKITDIPFFFKIIIPKEKAQEMMETKKEA